MGGFPRGADPGPGACHWRPGGVAAASLRSRRDACGLARSLAGWTGSGKVGAAARLVTSGDCRGVAAVAVGDSAGATRPARGVSAAALSVAREGGRGPRVAARESPAVVFFFLGDVRRCLAQVRSRWGNVADLTVVKEIRFTPVTAKGGVRWNLNLTRLTISGTPFA